MRQLGNLAVVCAVRPDVSLQIHDYLAVVHVGQGPQRAVMTAKWDDDEAICRMIRELNFGAYRHADNVPLTHEGQSCCKRT